VYRFKSGAALWSATIRGMEQYPYDSPKS